ncbi:CRISPR-associated endonuclease Cas1 [Sphaerotilus natans]|nr:CRISPR-associated endonuclease Cas1 [Sphaerotilus natans]
MLDDIVWLIDDSTDRFFLLSLAEAGVSTVPLSSCTGRRVAIVLGPAHNEATVRLAQAQRGMDPGWCVAWARTVVQVKLRQAGPRVLRRPPGRGAAAGAGLCRTQPAPAALDPLLGFYHRRAFGRESLASDLIELLRAEIDPWVAALLRDRTLREDHLTLPEESGGVCLLSTAGRQIFYARWAGEAASPPRCWLRWRSTAVARVLHAQGLASARVAAHLSDDGIELHRRT